MKYNPQLKAFLIDENRVKGAGILLLYALVEIRKAYNLSLDKYERNGPLNRPDHAQKNIINLANSFGIDLGASWGNEIDLREYDN